MPSLICLSLSLYINMDTKLCIATARQPNIQTQERATARNTITWRLAAGSCSWRPSWSQPWRSCHHLLCMDDIILNVRTVWTHTHSILPSFFNRQLRCFHDRSLYNHPCQFYIDVAPCGHLPGCTPDLCRKMCQYYYYIGNPVVTCGNTPPGTTLDTCCCMKQENWLDFRCWC